MVEVRFGKWGDQPHWEMDLRYLGEDEHGDWIGARPGLHMSRPGLSATTTVETAMLIPRGRPFIASFNGPGHDGCDIYVDITTIPVWEGSTVRAVDLDLDVIRCLDGRVEVDDEDEFAAHQVSYGYPQEVVDLAQRSCDDVAAAVTAGAEPWASVGRRWLRAAASTPPPAAS